MKKNKGMTLLEIIIVLTVLAFAIPAVLMSFSRIVGTGTDAQTAVVAANLAQEKMEGLIRGKIFADIASAGPSDFTTPFATYNYQITVDYVNAGNLDTPAGSPTDFKRVKVIITRDNMAGFNVTLSTVVTNLES